MTSCSCGYPVRDDESAMVAAIFVTVAASGKHGMYRRILLISRFWMLRLCIEIIRILNLTIQSVVFNKELCEE